MSVETQTCDDHYSKIAKAMQPGLLITVNNSGGANATGTGQLRVVRNPEGANVLLEGYNGTPYRLRYNLAGDVTLVKVDEGGDEVRTTDVESIEVIGIDG